MSACHRGRVEAAKALLRSGADPNYENDAGDLTLFWGIDGGIELIKVLLQYGADPTAQNGDGPIQSDFYSTSIRH